MKKLLLPILSLAVLASGAFAETVNVTAGTAIYRPIPKANSNDVKSRFRVTSYVPTLFYYTRDSVISYRYTAVASFAGTPDSGDYLGPHGARFIPDEQSLAPSATVRSFASVTHRGQPGVGMVAPTPVKVTVKKTTRTTTTTK
jgi:hypothetical protein